MNLKILETYSYSALHGFIRMFEINIDENSLHKRLGYPTFNDNVNLEWVIKSNKFPNLIATIELSRVTKDVYVKVASKDFNMFCLYVARELGLKEAVCVDDGLSYFLSKKIMYDKHLSKIVEGAIVMRYEFDKNIYVPDVVKSVHEDGSIVFESVRLPSTLVVKSSYDYIKRHYEDCLPDLSEKLNSIMTLVEVDRSKLNKININ